MPAILIIDDQIVSRRGLRDVLAKEISETTFGEAWNVMEALVEVEKRAWDLVTLTVSLRDRCGFQILGEIRRNYPAARVLVLSGDADPVLAAAVYRAGACGCVSTRASRLKLVNAVANVLAGNLHFDGLLANRRGAIAAAGVKVSAREKQIALLLASGMRASEIAAQLNLSVKTVCTFQYRLLAKLNLRSVAELVRYIMIYEMHSTAARSA